MTQLQERLQEALAGRYTIERELGRGGWSVVFLAWDKRNERPVALKALRPELVATIGRQRFLDEIRLIAQFNHPYILALHEWEPLADDLLYYVMPAEGGSLRDRLDREARLPVADAVQIAREVAEALEYAHQRGVIHRDIKPDNILFKAGHAVVSDFGIARAISVTDDGRLSGTGVVLGTPEYMSPEQARRGVLDGRTDVYSLGVTLYEMLAGELPRLDVRESVKTLERACPDVSPELARVVRRALAPAPADRFATAGEFAATLAAARGRRFLELPAVRVGATVAIALALFGAWRAAIVDRPPLDPNKVVVFPLVDRGGAMGEDVALMIGSALEHTDPLKWIDGWTWLAVGQKADAATLTPAAASKIARSRGAHFYVDGSIVRLGDSARVILRVHDVVGDSVVVQESVTGVSPIRLGLQAVTRVLPRLLEPGRAIDLAVLAERDPGAVAGWLQGEREYRRSRFQPALGYYRRALASDSALAVAALKGAEAADWQHLEGEALQLVDVALARGTLLPPKYVAFARGLRAYLTGAADSALGHYRRALVLDPEWSAAWAALGEVYYHLLPNEGPLDSLAEASFLEARRTDPDFAPPLHHLSEIALRAGDVRRAEALIETFRGSAPDSSWFIELRIMLDCVREGPQGVNWQSETRQHPAEVVAAAKGLARANGNLPCARHGFTAALGGDRAMANERWGALLGLQSVLVAEGRYDDARRLIDSAVSSGLRGALGIYVIDALAGAGMTEQAGEAIELMGDRYDSVPSRGLWYAGKWAAHRAETARLETITRTVTARAAASGDGNERLWADGLAAHLALVRADTGAALARFRSLTPRSSRVDLAWGLWEALSAERMKLAEVLLARGETTEAIRIADVTDRAGPVTFLLYARPSLELRLRAAERSGRPDLAARYRARLAALSRGPFAPSTP